MKKKLFSGLAIGLFLVGLSGVSHATILTFDGLTGYNYVAIDQNYGDNVTALSDGVGSYGQGNGFTPNITVSYNTDVGEAWLEAWDYDYGDLTNVAYPAFNGGTAEITFTPAPGFLVVLNSFDMAGWSRVDKSADVLEVFINLGSQIQQWTYDPAIEGDNGHSSFSPGLTGYELTIRFGNDWNIGIDNINFDQRARVVNPAVPEPTTSLLVGLGLAGLAGVARRRRS